MKLLLTLVSVAAAVSSTDAVAVCRTNRGENLIQFNKRNQDVFFPCKYWALKQQKCGKYLISLSPGNRYIYPKYQLDTLWLRVIDVESDKFWEGRTTNKLAVKFYNSDDPLELFNKKGGDLNTEDILEYGKDKDRGVFIQDKAGAFKLTFTPWDPENRKKFPNAEFEFECFDDSAVLNGYPAQLCGGSTKWEVQTRAVDYFGLEKRFRANAIYFDVFTNQDIVQVNPRCDVAINLLVNTCQSNAQRLNVINNCKDILHNDRLTKCVTHYNCDPMDVFNACVAWGCTGAGFAKDEKTLCAAVAEGIDFCPEIVSTGNLSRLVASANCYHEFLPVKDEKKSNIF